MREFSPKIVPVLINFFICIISILILFGRMHFSVTSSPISIVFLTFIFIFAGINKFTSGDGKQLADPEVLRRLTSSVSCALDEAAAALTRMRSDSRQASKR